MMNCSHCKHIFEPVFTIETIDKFREVFLKKAVGCKEVFLVFQNKQYEITTFKRINFGWKLWAKKHGIDTWQKPMTVQNMKAELANSNNWAYLETYLLDVAIDKTAKETIWGGVNEITRKNGVVLIHAAIKSRGKSEKLVNQ